MSQRRRSIRLPTRRSRKDPPRDGIWWREKGAVGAMWRAQAMSTKNYHRDHSRCEMYNDVVIIRLCKPTHIEMVAIESHQTRKRALLQVKESARRSLLPYSRRYDQTIFPFARVPLIHESCRKFPICTIPNMKTKETSSHLFGRSRKIVAGIKPSWMLRSSNKRKTKVICRDKIAKSLQNEVDPQSIGNCKKIILPRRVLHCCVFPFSLSGTFFSVITGKCSQISRPVPAICVWKRKYRASGVLLRHQDPQKQRYAKTNKPNKEKWYPLCTWTSEKKKVWSRFVVSPNVAQSLMRWYDDA